VESLRRHARAFIEGFALMATIVGFFILLPWPVWLIAGLASLVVFLLFLLWRQRPPRIDPGDQERLDELLHILNRRAEENIDRQDFYATWNGRIMNPLKVFAERYGPEHHFRDQALDQKRAALLETANKFLTEEAGHGFPPQRWGTAADRVPGYSPSEAEGITKLEETVERHRSAIYPAAQAFLRAHADFVQTARDRGYRIDALTRERHPDVQEWDQIQDLAEDRLRG
jgi:hypothetical protein